MDFGIHIGMRGCLTTREAIMAMASNAEAGGYAIIGDGWCPVSNNSHILMNISALTKAGIDRLHRAAEKAERDPGRTDIAYVWFMPPRSTARIGADGQRRMFTGGADDMLEDAAAFRDIGVRHLIVYLQQPTLEATLDVQQRFAEDVVRKST
jgi:hypothetical protein